MSVELDFGRSSLRTVEPKSQRNDGFGNFYLALRPCFASVAWTIILPLLTACITYSMPLAPRLYAGDEALAEAALCERLSVLTTIRVAYRFRTESFGSSTGYDGDFEAEWIWDGVREFYTARPVNGSEFPATYWLYDGEHTYTAVYEPGDNSRIRDVYISPRPPDAEAVDSVEYARLLGLRFPWLSQTLLELATSDNAHKSVRSDADGRHVLMFETESRATWPASVSIAFDQVANGTPHSITTSLELPLRPNLPKHTSFTVNVDSSKRLVDPLSGTDLVLPISGTFDGRDDGTLVSRMTVNVVDLAVNEVIPDSTFAATFPDGTVIFEEPVVPGGEQKTYVTGGPAGLAARMQQQQENVEAALATLEATGVQFDAAPPKRTIARQLTFYIGAGSLVAAVVLALLRRRRSSS